VSLSIDLPDDVLEQLAQRVADILEERQAAAGVPALGRWLTIAQAAEYIGAKRQRIYDHRSSGRLTRHGDGTRALVDRLELDQLVEGV
jgi:excisionase family DNA binding protein